MPMVNILLVDDHPADLLALRVILEELGQNLVQARSGDEALRRLEEDEFAVVLLDVQMPGLDGFETAKLIRGRETTRHTPILFVTAHEPNRLSAEEAYALGAVDYLVKPLVPVILRAKVAGFIDLFEKAEQIKRQAEQLRQLQRREFERQLAEESARLRESEGRFARFMHHLPGLAWIKDVRGRYVYANQAAEAAFRIPRAELYGKTDEEVFPPETASQFQENDRRALATGTGVQAVETLEHEDGDLHYSLVSKFPIPGPDGEAALVGGIAIDITDRMRAEEALREADRRKDEFLATLAHELRNPLASIRNGLTLMRRAGVDREAFEAARCLTERQFRQMVRLIDDLLDVSRIRRGKLVLRPGRIGLAAAVQSAVEETQPFIESCGHGLTVELPEEPIELDADPTRLAQVFSNLLDNAAKYSEPGGHIRLERRAAGERGRRAGPR